MKLPVLTSPTLVDALAPKKLHFRHPPRVGPRPGSPRHDVGCLDGPGKGFQEPAPSLPVLHVAEAAQCVQQEAPAGLSRTEIRDRLGRNAREADVERALGKLAEHGLAMLTREATGGRPVERWRASTTETTKG